MFIDDHEPYEIEISHSPGFLWSVQQILQRIILDFTLNEGSKSLFPAYR